MLSVLVLGFLFGMRHATDADHVAAVATLATRSASVPETLRLGVAWGIGHTLTLFAIGTVVLLLGVAIPERTAQFLELAVGVMLALLGLDVIRRIVQQHIHVHPHRHGGRRHVHAHGHEAAVAHDEAAHAHPHTRALPLRALTVGLVHGMAGSAALVLLTLGTIQSVWLGVVYMLLFGLGSILGMALLSFAIALPLRFTAHRLGRFQGVVTAAIGVLTLGIGMDIIWELGVKEGLLF